MAAHWSIFNVRIGSELSQDIVGYEKGNAQVIFLVHRPALVPDDSIVVGRSLPGDFPVKQKKQQPVVVFGKFRLCQLCHDLEASSMAFHLVCACVTLSRATGEFCHVMFWLFALRS